MCARSKTDPRVPSLRRLDAVDWRFLLPNVRPRRVAVIAPESPGWADHVAGGLEVAGCAVSRVTPSELPGREAGWDVIVCGDRSSTEAARRLPATTLVVRAPDRLLARPGVEQAYRRLIHGRGRATYQLRVVQWPPRGQPTELLPVVSGSGGDYLRQRRTGPAGRLAARLMPALATRLLTVLPSISIVSDDPPAAPLLHLLGRTPQHWLLVTPHFAASRHVVLIADDGVSPAPARVSKVARTVGDRGIADEARVLRAVAAAGANEAIRIPELLGEASLDGHPALVESWVTGDPLDPRRVRARPQAITERIVAWLRELVRGEARLEGERWQRLVAAPLERLDRLARATQLAAAGELAAHVRASVQQLHGATVPVAIEHGDLGHPNLLVTRSGEIGVIDWELGRTDGLAMVDLVFFLGWVVGAIARSETQDEHAAALDRSLISGRDWPRQVLLAEGARLGLDADAVDRLALLCWLTHATRSHDIDPEGPLDVVEARRAWAHRHRLAMELWMGVIGV